MKATEAIMTGMKRGELLSEMELRCFYCLGLADHRQHIMIGAVL